MHFMKHYRESLSLLDKVSPENYFIHCKVFKHFLSDKTHPI